MREKMKVSVIVPIYNVAAYLPACLDSVLSQTYRDFELILVDDGSTDGSSAICEAYRARDPRRVRVCHKENGGLVSARKTGLHMAEGEYILCVDGDDWIEPEMLELLCGAIERERVDLVLCGRWKDTGSTGQRILQGFPPGRYDKRRLEETIYPRMIVNGAFFRWGISPNMWDRLFRRDLLLPAQDAVDDRLAMGEDAACTYPYLLDASSAYIMEESPYHYRQSPASMTSRRGDPTQERERFHALYWSVREALERRGCGEQLLTQWRDYVLFLSVPRADILYQGIEALDDLFPFPEVRRGDTVAIYGAGAYGQRLYRYLAESGFCAVAALVDRNFTELRKLGLPVEPPEVLSSLACDAVVLAVSFYDVRMRILEDLRAKYPEKRICGMDEALVKSDAALRAFGML